MTRRKKRSAWASIAQVDATTWRIRFWADGPDGYRRRSKTIRNATRKQAEAARAQLMLEHGEDAPCPTVGQAWERWALPDLALREEGGDLSVRTTAAYRRSWAADVEPAWADVPCDQVRPLAVQQWLMGLGLSQARRALQLLALVLDYAVRYELCDHNAARERYLMPSKSTVAQRDRGVWTLDELGEVWRAVRAGAPWMEPAFLLAAFGGCRVSESVGPLAGEVALREVSGVPVALVPIVRQVTKETGVSDRLKTEQSRRTVVVPGRAALALGRAASELPPDWPLTHDGAGLWVSRDRVNRAWRLDVLPLLPEPQRHIFQNLRNSWQTNCRWSLGMPPWLVEPLMGHRGEGVTGAHYDRPQAELFAAAVADAYREHPFDAGWSWLDGPNWDGSVAD
jgi:integrase